MLAVWTLEGTDPNKFFQFQKCNDDVDFTNRDLTSELVLNTVAGKTYYVQVGGCSACEADGATTPDSGNVGLYIYPPPGNDRRANAQAVPLNTNVEGETWGALVEPGERTTCASSNGTAPLGKTAWYRFSTPKAGNVTVDASGFASHGDALRAAARSSAAASARPAGRGRSRAISPRGRISRRSAGSVRTWARAAET